MPVHNADVAAIFDQIADLLEIRGENVFRVRAYRNAARTIGDLPRNVRTMVEQDEDLTQLQGIGEDLAAKIREIVETGSLAKLEEIKSEMPAGLVQLLSVAGLGPKRVQRLNQELGITTLEELEAAASKGKIRLLTGFGAKLESQILADIPNVRRHGERILWSTAEEIVEPLVRYLLAQAQTERVVVAGSYRRKRETVGDLDVLAISDAGPETMSHFTAYEDVSRVLATGDTRSTVVLRSGLQVDLRVVPRQSYGAALVYFTGSKPHNIALRNLALGRGLKLNEYGVFRGDELLAGETEESVYNLLQIDWIPPELRENRGEIEAAQRHRLPKLVTPEDMRGDLQVHTTASDGRATLEEMVQGARDLGYKYLAITDHSSYLAVTRGLDASRLAARIEEIDRLNKSLPDIVILKGIEVDILEDGSLDLPDDILSQLDLTVCSVHSKFNLTKEAQTERIIRAMGDPYFTILAHPTGRQINKREPYEVDLEEVMAAARERGCFLEVNAHPERLDLDDIFCKMAKEMGVRLAINTDAHSVAELRQMRFGVNQARRGWLEKDDILNAMSLSQLRKTLRRRNEQR